MKATPLLSISIDLKSIVRLGAYFQQIVTISGLMTFARAERKRSRCSDVTAAFFLSCLPFTATRFARDGSSRPALFPRLLANVNRRRRQYGHRKHRERRFVRGTIEGQCISGRCATVPGTMHTRTLIHSSVTAFMQSGAGGRAREKGFLHLGLFTSPLPYRGFLIACCRGDISRQRP